MFRRMLLPYLLLPSTLMGAQIFVGDDAPHRLGAGLESSSQQWRPSCLEGAPAPSLPNRSIAIKMYASKSAEEILEEQRGYGSAQLDFWMLGAEARNEFILRHGESETQASFIWSVEYRGATLALTDRRLNARGQLALARSPAERRQLCGDQFILSAVLGARFHLTTSLIFDSQEKYRYFKTKVSASALGGLLKKDKVAIDEVRRMAQGAILSVQAFQAGGPTFDLDVLMASQPAYCTMGNLEPCLDRFEALHRYAFGADGFRKQVAAAKPEQLAVLWLNASSYQDAGHFPDDHGAIPAHDPTLSLASEQLFQWSGSTQQSMAWVEAQVSDPAMAAIDREKARLKLAFLQNKAQAIRSAADICADSDACETCRSRMDSLKAMVASP